MGSIERFATLVTGGGSGIGEASAARLAADGAHVTICGRTEQKLLDDYLAAIPLGRVGEPTEIADMVRFLIGPESY